jgi:hypothetical protein
MNESVTQQRTMQGWTAGTSLKTQLCMPMVKPSSFLTALCDLPPFLFLPKEPYQTPSGLGPENMESNRGTQYALES